MTWFHNLKLAKKLALGFGLCLLLSLLASAIAMQRMSVMNDKAEAIVHEALSGTTAIAQVDRDIRFYRLWQLRVSTAFGDQEVAKVRTSLESYAEKTQTDIKAYQAQAKDPVDLKNIKDLAASFDGLAAFTGPTFAAHAKKDDALCVRIVTVDSYARSKECYSKLEEIAAWNADHGKKLADLSGAAYRSARTVLVTFSIISLLVAIVIASFVTRIIVASVTQIDTRLNSLDTVCLNNLKAAMNSLAGGDLTTRVSTCTDRIETNYSDEFGKLGRSLNGIIDKTQETVGAFHQAQKSLSTMIGEAKTSSSMIAATSAEIASGNEDLSNRTSSQASSLEETAASMEEMTSIVKQNAENARTANKLAAEAREVAEQGGAIVNSAVESMGTINASSKQINDIVSVIDEIAFQTNLLALNAAVEAARVGEQGRGFAVVATEVRNLAGRSSTAAKEIKALVQTSVRNVEDGAELVNKSGEQLRAIVASVNQVADIVADISAASQEQSAGIEQVNKAVIQMDEITQQNAALVEQASAASHSMSDRANGLQRLVSRFKVDETALDEASADPSFNEPQKPRIISVAASRRNTQTVNGGPSSERPPLSLVHHDHDNMEEF